MSSSGENQPTSRPSTSEPPPQQQAPIGLFNHQLRYLSESYLSFFQERAKIEEVYVESLLRLHKKVKTMDTYLDDRSEPSTMRQVWGEVRDNVEREAQTRQAFLGTLTVDVIDPLLALKESQDRTGKRIKEDIKESTQSHVDFAENTLPRLKRNYLKKCQEAEDYKTSNISPPSSQLNQNQPDPLSLSTSKSNPTPISPSAVTSPQPLRPLTRRPSGHQPQPRNRSPSSSTALQDLAHQGKRQLNQLRTFLDNKGGTMKEGLAGGRNDGAHRSAKAKREADEADKEYRKGVHWLETLRLRRIKILEGGFKSLELFIEEVAQTMKKVLEKYADNATATSTTQIHLSTHVGTVISHISPQKDALALASSISRFLQMQVPRRTLYTNFHFGECNDLMFGVALVDYANSRGLHDNDLPKVVRICINEIDKRGLNSEGIYRVSGRLAAVQEVMHRIEKDERNFQFTPTDDIFVVSSLLKQYLRELPEPVFKFPLEDRVKHTEDFDQHVSNNFMFLRRKMRRLPPVHQTTLKAVVEHLSRVAAHSEKSKMDPKNLAIIFSGVIFGEDEMPKNGDLLAMQNWKDSLMEDLIVHAHMLFDERASSSSHSPPLPPAPLGEAQPPVGYGSAHTQVETVPPRRSTEGRPTQDFAPPLPARPGDSIHRSRRVNAPQANKDVTAEDEDSSPSPPLRPTELGEIDTFESGTSDATITQTHESRRTLHPVRVDVPPRLPDDAESLELPATPDSASHPVPSSPRLPRTPKSATSTLVDSSFDSPQSISAVSSRRSHEHHTSPPPSPHSTS